MKLSALHQSYLNRRNNNSFRSPVDSSVDGSVKSSLAAFWLLLHCLCCLISLLLGFRFSRLVFFFFLVSTPPSSTPFRPDLPHTDPSSNATTEEVKSSRVVVGRHGILIRPWPHPDPVEVMKAHRIIERVQKEQKAVFGGGSSKTVIAVTPTYVRTFQALHLNGVMHSLMLVPYDVVWIVVEAGGASNETALIIAKSGLRTIHVGFNQRMPNTWEDRSKVEVLMRLQALRVVKEEKLDGVVMFADDSNMHSMEFFDEIQNVKWFGAVSVGILAHSGNAEEMVMMSMDNKRKEMVEEESSSLPVQGPACNATDKLIGWHVFNTLPYAGKSAVYIDDVAAVLPQKLEWCGFVLNSRMLWDEAENKPEWVKEFGLLNENEGVESPLSLLNDASMVEPLGSCGRQVLLWWLRVEARADSKFPPGWIIDPPLEITVAAKRSPWPDVPPEPPTKKKDQMQLSQSNNVMVIPKQHQQQQQQQRSSKVRKPKRRSKRNKHEAKPTDTTTQVSSSTKHHQERN
ncbi:hypothetical protein N665_0255s0010 [Sinapis alba]|nr:hypothetical protein N665_0255s0010 [Sinapis alba]